jgi:uncharacterized protein (DUF488 family)
VETLLKLAAKDTTALLCAEENPAICHRRILVGAAVSDRGAEVWHIRGDSSLQADSDVIGSGKRQPRRLLEERQEGECTCGAVALFTIGFAGRTAEQFFGTLSAHGVRRVIDVRLKNQSQLAGFTKRQDLPYFLRTLCRAEYSHEVRLAPTDALPSAYRAEGDWASYERAFLTQIIHL